MSYGWNFNFKINRSENRIRDETNSKKNTKIESKSVCLILLNARQINNDYFAVWNVLFRIKATYFCYHSFPRLELKKKKYFACFVTKLL